MMTEPTPEHAWLKQLVGEWTFESACVTPPGQPEMKATGKETVRMLGDLWAVCEGSGDMPGGGPMTMRMTVGYDTKKKKFVGSWVGSPMDFMFVYEGTRNGNVLPLGTTGPDCMNPGKSAEYQDVIELLPDGRRTMTSRVKQPDGSWQEIMKATYTRVK